ncbi:hypothetical protein Tco_1084509 [Tanacetum coccineum]
MGTITPIDWKVESLADFKYKCFLGAYKGYHQSLMKKSDKENTAFYTNHGLFCYIKMPFGLKNASATYQALIDKEFRAQIGINLEAYNLQRINIKLNPAKCTFKVDEGQFLGHIIDTTGIRENPKKIQAVLDSGLSGSYQFSAAGRKKQGPKVDPLLQQGRARRISQLPSTLEARIFPAIVI